MTHLCQCLTIASVDSTIVPSMSNNKPSNFTISGWAVKDGSDPPSGDIVGYSICVCSNPFLVSASNR